MYNTSEIKLLEQVKQYAVDHTLDSVPGSNCSVLSDIIPYYIHHPTQPNVCIEQPYCAFVLQGEKIVLADNKKYRLLPGDYNLSVMDIPVTSSIISASKNHPYYGIVVKLNIDEISDFIIRHAISVPHLGSKMFTVSETPRQLTDILCRWINLFSTPDTATILAPLYRQEFYFWLLRQPESSMLFQLTKNGGAPGKIRRAIDIIRNNFNKNISMKELSATVSLSHSGFHQYFRQLTGLTPLQFQKQLRLQEARRLMLRGSDASNAGYYVGYESTSQFSREYRRHFGHPPRKDIARLREM